MMVAVLKGLVRAYQLLFSAWVGGDCRFEPSCSAYALQALDRHGAASGSVLAARRLLRCHPWCEGGHDPVPERPVGLFSRLVQPGCAPGVTSNSTSESSP
jgi:putative membrane protein insertion efficiency factor